MQKKRVLKKRITEESNAEMSIRLSQLEKALELEQLGSKAYNKNDSKNNTKL